MIKQSQIRNFISLIARKNAKLPNPSVPVISNCQKQKASSSRRYETEPIRVESEKSDLDDWLGSRRLRKSGQEPSNQNYIKLSLFQKYRRSLNQKRNKSLKTQFMPQTDSQQELKANQVVFPVKRPQKTVNKSKSLIKKRILSTPSHLMHLYPVESERTSGQKSAKLPQIPFLQPHQSLSSNQKQQFSYKPPIFRVKKYQPLNHQLKIDHVYNLFSQCEKLGQCKNRSKPRFQKWIKWSRRGKKGGDTDDKRSSYERNEAFQESVCGWVVEKGKSRYYDES